jgi:hypothetical protein
MSISNNFKKLMEDLKRSTPIFEDKETRRERREERKEKRKEEKFMDSSRKDFNLNTFIDSLTTLKNSIISQLKDCDNRIGSKVLGGKKSAEKYKPEFMKHLEKAAVLLGEATYRKDKGEGRKLESGDDLTTIESFREGYKTLLDEFNTTAKSYNDEAGKMVLAKLEDIDYKGIREPLEAANKAFMEAKIMSSNILNAIQIFSAPKDGESNTTTEGIKIENTIKEGTTPTGDNAEIAKKIFALICEKWKDSKTLTASEVWKKSIFCKPNQLIIGPNRTACIKAIKAAYGLKDATGNLTQDLVNKLSASEVIKESIGLPKFSEGKLLNFDTFLVKRKINEEVDMAALKASLETTVNTERKKGQENKKVVDTTFKSKEEGDAFRKWVNDTHKDWATENQLDPSGSHTNSYILKAWTKFKDEYSKKNDKKEEPKKNESKIDMAKIKKITWQIFLAMTGAYEDEDRVYEQIKKIDTKEEFEAVEKCWGNMKIHSTDELRKSEKTWKKYDVVSMTERNKSRKDGISFRQLFNKLFSDSEINKLNNYLPDGVKKI